MDGPGRVDRGPAPPTASALTFRPVALSPFLAVGVGVALVLALMLALRVHAFLALLTAALVVSAMTVGAAGAVTPVLESFGATAGKIGVVIALAAVIGKCLLVSGAADVIVGANVRLLGQRRAPRGLMAGGFVLAIPVFFDTVFYLLVPLARSLHRRTGAGYALCLMALAGGAAAAHALVPPTPGPLLVADAFGVSVGMAIAFGLAVAVPACGVAYVVARRLDLAHPLPMRPQAGDDPAVALPVLRPVPLALALLPIALPIALIGAREASGALGAGATPGGLTGALTLLGTPTMALFLATAVSLAILAYATGSGLGRLSGQIEESLLGAGVIILITAAGGAFGASLKATGIAEAIAARVDLAAAGGLGLMLGTFALASALKVAQGSSTVAMIVGSGMVAAVVDLPALGFDPVYLALAVGSGSLVGSWMNDSGFWIFAEMGGLTTEETLRTWTPAFAMVGVAALAITLVLSFLAPLR